MKSFKEVVQALMKSKSKVYNENVLRLAKSVVLSQQCHNIITEQPSSNYVTEIPELCKSSCEEYPHASEDTFQDVNPMGNKIPLINDEVQPPMTITFHKSKSICNIRFGSSVQDPKFESIVKQIL